MDSTPATIEKANSLAAAEAKPLQQLQRAVEVAIRHCNCNSYEGPDRRRAPRQAYPYPLQLTPLDTSATPLAAETTAVLGKFISPQGLDFYHREPLTDRRVIASLSCGTDRWVAFLLDLRWCRFNQYGWYESGGVFLRTVPSPLDRRP